MDNPNYFAVITADVRYNKNLKGNEKLMFGEITALSNKNGYCTAHNQYFADLFGCHKNTISDYISNLRREGLVKVELIYDDKTVIERRIYPSTKSLIPINQMTDTPISQTTEVNNTSINNKKEEERKTENRKSDLSKITKYYEDNITLIVPTIVEEIESYLEDGIEAELIITCIKEAVDRNRRNWKYIKTILNDCHNNKVFTVKQYEIKQKEFKASRNQQYKAKTQEIKYENDFSEYDNYFKREVQNE